MANCPHYCNDLESDIIKYIRKTSEILIFSYYILVTFCSLSELVLFFALWSPQFLFHPTDHLLGLEFQIYVKYMLGFFL